LRLSEREINIIKNRVTFIFGNSIIYLFGSRIDDTKNGGDIDLYIISKDREKLFQKKVRIKTLLEDILYKPIDIVIAKNPNRLIEKEALKGVILWQIMKKQKR